MQTKIMGIINTTPDSFSDGGSNENIENVLEKVGKWISLGCDIIDVGGESTRPGSEPVSIGEEIARTQPIVAAIANTFPQAIISIDTMKYEVAAAALDAGATIINDVSGLRYSPKLADLAASKSAELVIMHLPSSPKTMQNNPTYDNLIEDVFRFLQEQIQFARDKGVEKIIADVGIGFGKTFDDNWTLLKHIERFHSLGVPLLLGISRKRFIGEFLGISEPNERDAATMLIHSLIIDKGIDIMRVHNVELAIEMRKIANRIKN